MEHTLKTDPGVFELTFEGVKNYEIRFNDRMFKKGDKLKLVETVYSGCGMTEDNLPLKYTGREALKVITHVLKGYGLTDGWVILSVENLATTSKE